MLQYETAVIHMAVTRMSQTGVDPEPVPPSRRLGSVAVSGRETDVADAKWLAELLEHGLPPTTGERQGGAQRPPA